MKIAVIIPNYNGKQFLDPCMSALSGQTCRDFCVIIVDNGSADGSVETIRGYEEKGAAIGIYLPENTGFSGAVNAGIEHALSLPEPPEYVVLLNNDTEAEPEYLEKMLSVMEFDSGKRIGAVSPLMISQKDRSLIDSAGDGYALTGWAYQRGVGRKRENPKFRKRTGVFSACAGAAMYRLSALCAIRYADGDYFDRKHFAYLEDVDVSFRMRILGYGIVYEPESRVVHFGSGTSGSRYNDFKVRLAARNNVYLNCKNMPLLMLLVDLPFILAGLIIKQMFFVSRGFGKTYAKGVWEGLRTLPEMRSHHLPFTFRHLKNYLAIELRMIADFFSYLEDLFERKVRHR